VIGSASACSSSTSMPATLPRPPDGQTGVLPDGLVIGWHAPHADSVDLYLGTSPDTLPLLEAANDSGMRSLALLESDTRYYWQVVPRDAGGPLCAPGSCESGCCPVWSFTTGNTPSRVEPAGDPVPADGSGGIELLPRLAWSPGDALAYSIHLWPAIEERPVAPLASTASNELWVREPLRPATTYRWTVIALGSAPEADAAGPLWSFTTAAAFRRGDSNGDGRADLSDAIATLGYLFLGSVAISCLDAADADDSGVLNLTDAIFLLGHLFLGGPAPPPPGIGDCGGDLTEDGLSCEGQPGCP
jgi:hypothetical protein